MKRQPTELEKIFAIPLTEDYYLIQRTHEGKYQENSPIKLWANDLNREFPKKKYKWIENTLKSVHQ